MGARQSKRSVDITTTPKKEGIPAEGGVVGDAAAPGDGKLERIEEADTKPTTNGIAPHTDSAEDKEKDKDEATEKDKEQQPEQQEEVKAEETKQESSGDSPAEVEVTTPTEATPASPNTATSPDNKETKKKDKKKKWSFRSISFSKKDKTKPSRDETPKNGDVTKEEPLAEGGEDAENATATASSPEEKSAASSPSADEQVAAPIAATEPKEEAAAASPTAAAAVAAAASPVEEKKKEPTPSAPTPVPSVEDKKEEAVEKVEAEKKVVEVSQSAGGHSVANPVDIPVYRVKIVATPSIIERKASEDLPPLPPSSPPPTPIDPSPLQQARQAAANATALAEALKLPAVAAAEESTLTPPPPDVAYPLSHEDTFSQESRVSESTIAATASPTSLTPSTDALPPTEATFVLAEVECLPVVEAEIEVETSQDIARKIGETLGSSRDKKAEVEQKVVGDIAKEEKVFKCQENEANRAKETLPLAMECDTKNTPSKDVEKVPDVVAMAKVMNEALPVVECQTKNEINSCEVAMKINVLPNAEGNEKVEAETLSSAGIEIKDACPVVKQYLSSENMGSSPNKTQHIESTEKLSDSDLSSVQKCVSVDVEKSSEVCSASFAKVIESPSRDLEHSPAIAEVVEQSSETSIEYEHDYARYVPKEDGIASITSPTELFINSEEGPLSVSEDILVEAKPALIIPEDDSVEELTDTTESIKVIPETDEEKLETELELDTVEPSNKSVTVSDNYTKNDLKAANETDNTLPRPPEELISAFGFPISELQNTSAIERELIINKKDDLTSPEFGPLVDLESTHHLPLLHSDVPTHSLSEKHSNEPQTLVLSESESVPISSEDLPPAPEDTGTQNLDSFDYPLPPEELSCPLLLIPPTNISVAELPPAPVEHAVNPRDPTETLLTPPISPNLQQSSVTPGIATETATKDRSQVPSYNENDSNDREKSLLSEPLTISCDQSNIELKERLATEYVAKTESQEEALSCQLSNSIPLTAAKEHHQNAPEVKAPVENNIAHDVSTTENVDEAPKVAPPAIPIETPASPPTAPAITEDVASVTKAIEEIDISDKAVAAAVNEVIECNTNEIIADAQHQNINE
ncbi:nascent polypeptide-associated complex subunit alpha, muscle-specific form [Solenopsis invicta]|uniref:nascent polypeptide-associated complex subunit alpha, muscle-specific form n=1 Tax=Solenopsis invicta TaxID=13686 RepID=UPI000E33D5C0|nr:nascent polypeptide-associated complex subunit alpha, muscle-specific form [Solenopsis invicta]XP_039305259.1 nascent polypeptide-associated complex subunit alpha, muscle-specific form [Solenopsis invicta]